MIHTKAKLTVFFEDPFWVGIYERESNGLYEVCKTTFSAEPKDPEIYLYFLAHWHQLRFSPLPNAEPMVDSSKNPKRMQREAKKATQSKGAGTKAQQALKLQHEQVKLERKARLKVKRADEAARRFLLQQTKLKAKHRGR